MVTSETSQRKPRVEQSDAVIRLTTKVNDWGGGRVANQLSKRRQFANHQL